MQMKTPFDMQHDRCKS